MGRAGLGDFQEEGTWVKDPRVCSKSYSQLLFRRALPTSAPRSCQRHKGEAKLNLWQNSSPVYLPLEGPQEVSKLGMCVWHGYLTCRHHWPWKPSGLHQPTVLGPSRLGYPLTPQILLVTVSIPEMWTGQNLPAAKEGKEEEVGDGQSETASRIPFFPHPKPEIQIQPSGGGVEG